MFVLLLFLLLFLFLSFYIPLIFWMVTMDGYNPNKVDFVPKYIIEYFMPTSIAMYLYIL